MQEQLKSHYNVNEVLEKLQVKPYFLRFWESEFEQVTPLTSGSGKKIYTTKDLLVLERIKNLLSHEQVPIQKAKALIDKEFKKSNESHNGSVNKVKKVEAPKKHKMEQTENVSIQKVDLKLPVNNSNIKEFMDIKQKLQKAKKLLGEIKELYLN